LIGSTSDEDDAYQANITAFLTREASQQECQQWFVDRKNALRNLFQRVQGQDMSAYFEVEDNGC
jgi:DNA-binding protein Fis